MTENPRVTVRHILANALKICLAPGLDRFSARPAGPSLSTREITLSDLRASLRLHIDPVEITRICQSFHERGTVQLVHQGKVGRRKFRLNKTPWTVDSIALTNGEKPYE